MKTCHARDDSDCVYDFCKDCPWYWEYDDNGELVLDEGEVQNV